MTWYFCVYSSSIRVCVCFKIILIITNFHIRVLFVINNIGGGVWGTNNYRGQTTTAACLCLVCSAVCCLVYLCPLDYRDVYKAPDGSVSFIVIEFYCTILCISITLSLLTFFYLHTPIRVVVHRRWNEIGQWTQLYTISVPTNGQIIDQ